MTGEWLGAYQLIEEVGTGAMATVYRALAGPGATGLAEGEQVAIKVLHPHLHSTEGFLQRFLQEVEIGKKVVHRNVVRTLDAGAEQLRGETRYFLVMEFVEGQTLMSLLGELGQVNERLCRHVGRELASGLAAIHRSEIIHRDIKPANALITRDEAVRVMDLGVSFMRDRAIRLTQAGKFVGTVAYAAPEQLASGRHELDGRADLYALGLLLYELVTGEHPFICESSAETIRRQMEDEPERPSRLNPQVSPFLEELILRLLRKDREDRFATADELRDILADGESGTWWQSVVSASEVGARTRLRRMRVPRETSLFGRGPVVEMLRAIWTRAKEGEGQVVLLEGETGIGKTRLVDEFAALLAREGENFSFIFGEYPPAGAATASRAFSNAYLQHLPKAKLEARLAALLGKPTALVSAFASFLRGEPLPASAGLNQDAILATFANLNRGLAAERPTFILIDDLHYAPEEGRALFATLAHAHASDRILLVGTARPGLPADYIAGLTRLGHVTQATLDRLGIEEVTGILGEALGSRALASELAPRLARESDGVPYFLFEILTSLKQEKHLTPNPDGSWALAVNADRLPVLRSRSVKDLVHSRILPLEDPEREILEAAACCGFEFDPMLVADAIGSGRIPALKRLGQLERRHRIVRSMGRSFTFDHHHVQEAIYGALSLPLREEYHSAIGHALEARETEAGRGPDEVPGEIACAIAVHLLKGGQGKRARPFLEAALEHLAGTSRNHRALELADLGLAVPGLLLGTARARCLLTKGKILRILGRGRDTEELMREALGIAEEGGATPLVIEIRRELGRRLWESGRSDEAVALLEHTADLAAEVVGPSLGGSILGDLGHALSHTGRYDDAADCYERSLAAARGAGDRYGEATAIGNLGLHAYELGRLEEARDRLAQTIPILRELGNLSGEGMCSGNLGLVCIDMGEFQEARARLERSLEISREIGYRRGEANALGNLGLVHRANGRYGLAQESFENDLRIRRETGDRWNEGLALQFLGGLHRLLGDLDGARVHLERSLQLLDETGFRWGRVNSLLRLGELHWEDGDNAKAEGRYLESLTEAREIGKTVTEGEVLLALGRLHTSAGDHETARTELEACRELGLKTRTPNNLVPAEAGLCLLGDDTARARLVLEEQEKRLYRYTVMEVRFLLWRSDRRTEDLDGAKRDLEFLVEHAPERYRTTIRENVRLHREIIRAPGGS